MEPSRHVEVLWVDRCCEGGAEMSLNLGEHTSVDQNVRRDGGPDPILALKEAHRSFSRTRHGRSW